MAAALQTQSGDAVGDTQVLNTASVRAEVRPDPIERTLNPGINIQRVQVVQQ